MLPVRLWRGAGRDVGLGSCLLASTLTFLPPFPARALPPAKEAGACSLEKAVPATVAAVDDDFALLLDDGRRAGLSGLEFPADPEPRAKAHARLSGWLAGRDVFLASLAPAPDRWGRLPAGVFAASDDPAEAPLTSVGASLLEEGRARFRPDPPAAPCARDYLAAEETARAARRGLWADPALAPVDASAPGAGAALLRRKGLVVVEGKIFSVGESPGALYLNFGQKGSENFAAVILRRNLAMFGASGIDPRKLVGRRARVRGLIETGFGPRMEISAPAEIELLENPSP